MGFMDRFVRIIRARKVEIEVSEGEELRIRAYMERMNADQGRLDGHANNDGVPPYDLKSDYDFVVALNVLLNRGLEQDETAHGLFGTNWGELRSLEQVDEAYRRRRGRQEGGR